MLFSDLLLFAQNRGGGQGGQGGEAVAGIVGCFCYGLIFVGAIAYAVWFFMTTYRALDACSPRNRDMEPGQVFLMLIPLFGAIWIFFIIFRIGSSLEKEYRSRGLATDGDMGATLGMWGSILNLIGCGMIGIILMIIWLSKISGYTKRLKEGGGRRRIEDDDDDDDDDRPSRRRRDDDD